MRPSSRPTRLCIRLPLPGSSTSRSAFPPEPVRSTSLQPRCACRNWPGPARNYCAGSAGPAEDRLLKFKLAMLPDISRAIRLQNLDDRAAELTKEIATLPKHIAEIEKKLEAHQRRLDHDRAAL